MKVILSRKGFDDENGGASSPILPNGELFSLPIPISATGERNGEQGVNYSDLNSPLKCYKNVLELMIDLGIKIQNPKCHLDPDIRKDIFSNRGDDWTGSFGQGSAAQSHLNNQYVKKGDLFLFYGTFKKTVYTGEKIKFVDEHPFHVLWGFLRIGETIEVDSGIIDREPCLLFLKKHPHYINRNIKGYSNKKKTILFTCQPMKMIVVFLNIIMI